MDDRNREIKNIVVFLALTFASTVLFAFLCPLEWMDSTSGAGAIIYSCFPALCALLTRRLAKESFTYRALWLESPNGKGIPYSLLGWYGVLLFMLLGYGAFFLFNRSLLNTEGVFEDIRYTLAMTVLVAPVALAGIFLMGEELGWRGYLLPKLTAVLGVVPATVVIGLIWACWHIPLLIVMERAGGVGLGGVVSSGWFHSFVTVYLPLCLSMSMVCSFVTLKSGSALAAGCAHASYNTYITAFDVFINYEGISGFSINRPFYYVIILMFSVGVPMMFHLYRLEKQGKLSLGR